MRVIATLALFGTLVACGTSPAVKNERVGYWQRKIAQELHVGMTKGEVKVWGDSNHLKFSEQFQAGKLDLVASPEDVPGKFSILTGCKGWNIDIYILFDASERMSGDIVRAVGVCI